MKSRALLITGANGFLARAVVRQLTGDWIPVALVRPGTTASSSFEDSHDSVENMIRDLKSVDAILHLAACVPSPVNSSPPELELVNVGLIEKLVSAYPSAHHVLASSVSVYGTPESLPLTVTSQPNSPNPYGLSKLKAERVVRTVLRHTIIRFSSLIGDDMKPGTFIPAVVAAARAGQINLLGNGERLQNYLDLDDAAQMCLQGAISGKSSTVLGVGTRSYSNNEVASILAKLTGASVVRSGTDDSPSFVYATDNAMDIGRPLISLAASLEKMVQRA